MVPFTLDPLQAKPSEELRATLRSLVAMTGVEVYIISGRDRQFMENNLSDLGLVMVAEHGSFLKKYNGNTMLHVLYTSGQWSSLVDIKTEWRAKAMSLMQLAVDSAPGSHIEVKVMPRHHTSSSSGGVTCIPLQRS